MDEQMLTRVEAQARAYAAAHPDERVEILPRSPGNPIEVAGKGELDAGLFMDGDGSRCARIAIDRGLTAREWVERPSLTTTRRSTLTDHDTGQLSVERIGNRYGRVRFDPRSDLELYAAVTRSFEFLLEPR